MIDPNTAMLAWLKSSPDLTALVGNNIFSPVLPESFSCADGAKAVVVRRRGGTRHPEIPALIDPSFAIEAWALNSLDASQIAGIFSDLIHGATSVDLGISGFVVLAQEEVSPQDVIDPVTHWAMCFAYYTVKLRNEVSLAALLPPPMITYPFHHVADAGTNALSIQASPRALRGYRVFNNAGYPLFVKLHDTASLPVAGSTPVKYTIGVQAGELADTFPVSLWFSEGIGMTIVQGISDDDATPIAANDCVVDLAYE